MGTKKRLVQTPERISVVLEPLLQRLDTGGQFGLARLAKAWPEAVGETMARRTELQSLEFRAAVVKVSGAMWIQELNLMKPRILARLRRALGEETAPRDLRFVRGTPSRREQPRLRAVPPATRRSAELPELKDPELRRVFENLIEAWGRASR